MAPPPRNSTAVDASLTLFRQHLFEAMMNPTTVPSEDVVRSWQVWEAATLRDELECTQKIQRYLERDHTERLELDTEYTNYTQFIQQTKQAYESSTLGDRMKTRRAYLRSCMKPEPMLRTPSSVYTMEVKKI